MQTVTASVYKDGEIQTIDSDIDYRYVSVKGNHIAYITDYKDTEVSANKITSGGELKIYNGEKVKTIDSDVTAITEFN